MSKLTAAPGANIRALREAYGETQLDLAHALGFDSPATISMYESGERGQNRMDVISAIAAHYRITEDELLHGDFSGLHFDHLFPSDPDRTFRLFEKLIDTLLPIQTGEKDNDDPVFRFTHTIHLRRYKKWKTDLPAPISDFELCTQQYKESLSLHGTPESAANLLWWIVFRGLHTVCPQIDSGLYRLIHGKITLQTFLREQFLPCPADALPGASSDFHREYDLLTSESLQFLYKNDFWWPLAEYYSALLYTAGLAANSNTDAENRRIGREMMKELARLGNPYVIALREVRSGFHRV